MIFLCMVAREHPTIGQEMPAQLCSYYLFRPRDIVALLPLARTHHRNRVGVFGLFDETAIFRQVLVQLCS